MTIWLTVVVAITCAMHYLLWARLVRDTALPPTARRIGTALVVLGGLVMLSAPIAHRAVELPRWLVGSAWVWAGTVFLMTILLGAGDVGKLLGGLAVRLGGGSLDAERRLFLARVIGVGATASVTTMAGIGVREALRRPQLRRVRVQLERLPAAMSGLMIVQISDLHVGATIRREEVADLVSRCNAIAPDLVAITGDLVDGSVEFLADAVAPLADLRARHGVFFVTGNHEYYSGADAWIAHLGTLGVRVLRNERVVIGDDEASFDLAGVDDWSAGPFGGGHGPDLERALAGRDGARELILLAHQPRQIHEAAAAGVGLQLSGHTHGGQIWPFNYLVRLQQPFVAGLDRLDRTQIYVSRGTGYWGPPMRVAAPAEVTLLEIVATA